MIVFSFNWDFGFSDILTIIGTIINIFLAIWLVNNLQNSLNNKRVLKDHLIDEVKGLRSEYRDFITELFNNKLIPRETLGWFKLTSIKSRDLMLMLNVKYEIPLEKLDKLLSDLRKAVTEDQSFIDNFNTGNKIITSESTKNLILQIQQKNIVIFNELIILINDFKN